MYVQVLNKHLLPDDGFTRKSLTYFSNTITYSKIYIFYLQHLSQQNDRRIQVVNWHPGRPHFSPNENIWCTMEHKIQHSKAKTVYQLESYIRQKQDNICLKTFEMVCFLRHKMLCCHSEDHNIRPQFWNTSSSVAAYRNNYSFLCLDQP